jgi:hypothetical protein
VSPFLGSPKVEAPRVELATARLKYLVIFHSRRSRHRSLGMDTHRNSNFDAHLKVS